MIQNICQRKIVMILFLSLLFIIPVYGQIPDSIQGPIPIWSNQTGVHDIQVQCSSDGRYVVTGSDTGILRMYNQEGKTLWSFKRDDQMVRSVSISGNGDYVGAVFLNPEGPSYYAGGAIFVFNRTGSVLWNYTCDYTVEHVAISDNGNTIYASGTPNLYSFDRNGTLIGQNESDGRTWVLRAAGDGSYAVAGGTIMEKVHIAGSNLWANQISVFERNGTISWRYPTRQSINSIGISSDMTTIVTAARYQFSSFSCNGTLMWQLNSDPDISSIAVSSDGGYTAAGTQFYVALYDRAGAVLWKYKHSPEIRSAGISDDGNVIVAGGSTGVYVLNRTGALLWHYGTPKSVSHVSVARNGEYFAVSTPDTTYFFNRWGNATVPEPEGTPAVSYGGAEHNLTLGNTVQGTTQSSPVSSVVPVVALMICTGFLWRFIGKRDD
ncbi:PQQ-binding-like beta-propeller repeat protein [Methanoregula sp.]|uniref:outer membrane protein assembly factor BamB family protein n=1 Tax=Methanoregula sp. TaxID=2052170 RepID=UPI00356AB2BF